MARPQSYTYYRAEYRVKKVCSVEYSKVSIRKEYTICACTKREPKNKNMAQTAAAQNEITPVRMNTQVH